MPDPTPALLARYDRPVPRYTSYPPADRFSGAFGVKDYEAALDRAEAEGADAPLSLYVHLPFCPQRCHYCGCHMVVTRRPEKMARYVDRLVEEMDLVLRRLPTRRRLAQLHWGGGTPNAHPLPELARLMAAIRDRFDLLPAAEVALEIDPRLADRAQVLGLRRLGFDRISMGVQDLDPGVQEAIGRIQPLEVTRRALEAAREAGFRSVSFDLIYGLPGQDRDRFARTIDEVVRLAPDRVALFAFAWLPEARPHQRAIDAARIPPPDRKLALFCDARRALLDAGYEPIGMDHFARPGDDLARAAGEGRLHRSFQGYSVMDVEEVLGFGVSAIGFLGGAFVQTEKKLADWHRAVAEGRLPVARGHLLTRDDRRRRSLVESMMCRFEVDARAARRVPGAGDRLDRLAADGLVREEDGLFRATPLGRVLVRVVASAFDPRFAGAAETPSLPYARAI